MALFADTLLSIIDECNDTLLLAGALLMKWNRYRICLVKSSGEERYDVQSERGKRCFL